MGEVSDVFAANEGDLVKEDLIVGVPAGLPVVRVTRLDPVKLGFLAEALGCSEVDALDAPVAMGPEGVPVVLPISPVLADRLAGLSEDDLETVAADWAGGPVGLEGGEDGEEVVLRGLAELAKSAGERRMYLWWAT